MFLDKYDKHTVAMEHITILTEAKFIINDLFGDITCEEVEKHRVRIDNL